MNNLSKVWSVGDKLKSVISNPNNKNDSNESNESKDPNSNQSFLTGNSFIKSFLKTSDKESKKKSNTDIVLPWNNHSDPKIRSLMENQIKQLWWQDEVFIGPKPAGFDSFEFDFNNYVELSKALLDYDERLSHMRLCCCPKYMNENEFWKRVWFHIQMIMKAIVEYSIKQESVEKPIKVQESVKKSLKEQESVGKSLKEQKSQETLHNNNNNSHKIEKSHNNDMNENDTLLKNSNSSSSTKSLLEQLNLEEEVSQNPDNDIKKYNDQLLKELNKSADISSDIDGWGLIDKENVDIDKLDSFDLDKELASLGI